MKRPIMGHIGVKLIGFAVITSDNPRTEDPMAIIEDILTGVKTRKTGNVLLSKTGARPSDMLWTLGKKMI